MDVKLIPVRLTLTSSGHNETGEVEEPIRVMTSGQLRKTPLGYMLRYEESLHDEDTGQVQISQVILSMQPGRVVMNRLGDFAMTLVFEKDTRFESQYHTPYGNLMLALYTTQVHVKLSPEKGSIFLEYQIDSNGTYAITRVIAMEYTAEGQATC